MKRRKTKELKIGRTAIGGNNPIAVQSMTNTDTRDIKATIAQIKALEERGCDIIRLAIPDIDAAKTLSTAKKEGVCAPLVADIHFDWRIAIASAENGADKIRINPGNIGSKDKVREVAACCAERGIPIRIGVNGGSLEKSILEKHGAPTPGALVESALHHAALLEELNFTDIVISIKASSPKATIEANRLLASSCPYNLHIGVTETGAAGSGIVKSAVGIGTLLSEGIGDTVRVSLTADPAEEVAAAREILSALGLNSRPRLNIISCPTCGRTKIDLISLVNAFEAAAKESGVMNIPLTVAIMGCAVNGPGEAREADIGVAGGIGEALLFRRGQTVCKIPESEIVKRLIEEIKNYSL